MTSNAGLKESGLDEIRKLLNLPHGETKFKAIDTVATKWFIARDSRRIGGTPKFEVTDSQALVQQFVFEMNSFFRMSIPFNLWGDIAEQGLNLLREMIDSNQLNYKKSLRFKDFEKHYFDRVAQISKMPEYADMFGDGYY